MRLRENERAWTPTMDLAGWCPIILEKEQEPPSTPQQYLGMVGIPLKRMIDELDEYEKDDLVKDLNFHLENCQPDLDVPLNIGQIKSLALVNLADAEGLGRDEVLSMLAETLTEIPDSEVLEEAAYTLEDKTAYELLISLL